MEHLKRFIPGEDIFIHFGSDSLVEIPLEPSYNGLLYKPCNGLWSCKYTPNSKHRSAWEEYCSNNQINWKNFSKYVLFKLKKDARILLINDTKDFGMVAEVFQNKFEGWLSMPLGLDYHQISKYFDGIYLTKDGQMKNFFNLYGWDVESLVLFNLNKIILV